MGISSNIGISSRSIGIIIISSSSSSSSSSLGFYATSLCLYRDVLLIYFERNIGRDDSNHAHDGRRNHSNFGWILLPCICTAYGSKPKEEEYEYDKRPPQVLPTFPPDMKDSVSDFGYNTSHKCRAERAVSQVIR